MASSIIITKDPSKSFLGLKYYSSRRPVYGLDEQTSYLDSFDFAIVDVDLLEVGQVSKLHHIPPFDKGISIQV